MPAGPVFVFDVSTITAGDSVRPTGIHRVVLELAIELIQLTHGAVEFTRLDRATGVYRKVSHESLLLSVSKLSSDDPAQSPTPSSDRTPTGCVARRAYGAVAAVGRHSPATARTLKQFLAHARRTVLAALAMVPATRSDRRRRRAARVGECHSRTWSAQTIYCSVGADFAHNDLDHLRRCKEASGCSVAVMVHDLIPVIDPQYMTRDLAEYFRALIELADTAIVSSDHVHRDVQEYVAALGLQSPRVVKVPLSSSISGLTPVRPPVLSDAVVEQGFVMYVSTITLRKNHHLLFDVWLAMLASRPPEAVPYLLVVGIPGSLSEETMSRVRRDATLRQRVIHFAGLSDAEIAWLYQHSAFTVYPSLAEGWGLPVTESLDFAKVCIASDRTSLPEAGEGLALHLDAVDRAAWRAAVEVLWDDPAQRSERESAIVQQHQRMTPRQTATALLDGIGLSRLRDV